MLINLDTSMIGFGKVPLKDLIPLAVKYGYGTVQFPLWEITKIEQAKQASNRLADNGLKWALLPMDLDILRESSEEIFKEELEILKKHMDLGQAAGVSLYYNHVWPPHTLRHYVECYIMGSEVIKA